MILALVQVMPMRVHPDTCTGSTLSLPWRGGERLAREGGGDAHGKFLNLLGLTETNMAVVEALFDI